MFDKCSNAGRELSMGQLFWEKFSDLQMAAPMGHLDSDHANRVIELSATLQGAVLAVFEAVLNTSLPVDAGWNQHVPEAAVTISQFGLV